LWSNALDRQQKLKDAKLAADQELDLFRKEEEERFQKEVQKVRKP
jgi:hypothetical protein